MNEEQRDVDARAGDGLQAKLKTMLERLDGAWKKRQDEEEAERRRMEQRLKVWKVDLEEAKEGIRRLRDRIRTAEQQQRQTASTNMQKEGGSAGSHRAGTQNRGERMDKIVDGGERRTMEGDDGGLG